MTHCSAMGGNSPSRGIYAARTATMSVTRTCASRDLFWRWAMNFTRIVIAALSYSVIVGSTFAVAAPPFTAPRSRINPNVSIM